MVLVNETNILLVSGRPLDVESWRHFPISGAGAMWHMMVDCVRGLWPRRALAHGIASRGPNAFSRTSPVTPSLSISTGRSVSSGR